MKDKLSCNDFINKYIGKDNDYFVQKEVIACPYCKGKLDLWLPSINKRTRKELSKCHHCYKDIVICAEIEQVEIKYDLKVKKVG